MARKPQAMSFDDLNEPEPAQTFTPSPAADMSTVVVTCDHVYLPLDDEGNVIAEWRDCPGEPVYDDHGRYRGFERPHPTKVENGTKLSMPSELARMLSNPKRKQVVVV
jgi:hypothetical protein